MMPEFDWRRVIIDPWTADLGLYGWIMLMAFFVALACAMVGNYLILRRMALVGDAISHSVLPGLVVSFLVFGSLSAPAMALGAVLAGVVTTVVIEFIHTRSRIKSDAAIGITFCTLFALGVVLLNVFAGKVHLDAECVLFGELSHIPWASSVHWLGIDWPKPVLEMGGTALAVVALVTLLFKELLITSFDPALAGSMGFRPKLMHYGLMALLSIVVVAAFESVGAILVIAMLILPGASAQLLSRRLSRCQWLSALHAALSAVLGIHLGIWLDCSLASAVVIAGSALFGAAWMWKLSRTRFIKPSAVLPA